MRDSPDATEKLAKILRTPKDLLLEVSEHLSVLTGKSGVMQDIVESNDAEILEALHALKLSPGVNAKEMYGALIAKIEADDHTLYELFRKPDYSKPEAYKTILGFARDISRVGEGLFLKHEKARELLAAQPPKNIMRALGYETVQELLSKEDLVEVYSALRFLEEAEWLNTVFFKQYDNVTPADFEMRPIEVRVLSPQWVEPAEKFMKKKHHNLSHLKELGVIFVIPWTLGHEGETMRMFSLLVHYMHEIEFYSKLFEKFSAAPETFAEHFISSLRGDILETRPPNTNSWLIVQRYLAKDDENDWRLFWPHVNPEALHWRRAEEDLVRMGMRHNMPGIGFWHSLDWVGDYFGTDAGINALVSFDLVDNAMSLVKRKEATKYLYHHQEALWNKIFESYFSKQELSAMIFDQWEDYLIRLS